LIRLQYPISNGSTLKNPDHNKRKKSMIWDSSHDIKQTATGLLRSSFALIEQPLMDETLP
jgi:hypothetical protein